VVEGEEMKYIAFILALVVTSALAQTTAVPTAQITTAASDATAIATTLTTLSAQQKKLGRPNTAATITGIAAQATSLSNYILAWTHGSSVPPPPVSCTINSVALSNNSFIGGAPSGTIVGAINVGTSGTCGTDTLSLSGTNASDFQIVGANLETNGVVAAGSYDINIVAAISGATASPFAKPEAITGTSPSAMVYPFPNSLTAGILVNGVITPGTTAGLPAYTGPTTITVNGTTISGKTISSALTINANNVTIENNYFPISGVNNFLCIVNNGTGTLISHNEMNGTTAPGVAGAGDCIVGMTMTVQYNNVYGYAKSLYVSGGGVTAVGNYFWLTGAGSGTEHQEQTYINGDDTMTSGTFTGNTMVDKTANANPIAGPIFLASQNGTTSNIVVGGNLLVGGGYPLFWDSSTAHPRNNNTIQGNTLGVGQYGGYSFQNVESSSFGTGNLWSGNVDLLTGAIAAGDGSGNTTPNPTITLASFLSQGNSTEPAFTIDSSTFAQYVATAAVITLTGDTKAGDGVNVYDGASLLGTATANGTTGVFTFTTGTLSAGVHVFTAVDTTSPMTSAKFYVLIP